MATVTFKDASRIYPKAKRAAVDQLNLQIDDGEFLVLVGPSGCGKTTSLRMLAGLEAVDEGDILIDDKSVVNLAPRSRDIAMVFQNYALYPHMNVAENMGFALKIAKLKKSEITAVFKRRRRSSISRTTCSANRDSSPAASASVSRWAARSSGSRMCS
jgi:multiple sugar transport system ATP-binding protein